MLIDKYNRKIDYLRISVTDRCNLRCVYCMPERGIVNKPHEELLTFEEIIRIVEAGVYLGINKIRLTGGEPLVRKDLAGLVSFLNKIEGIEDISMTTNGVLLKEFARQLKQAGLKRLNISLDSLRHDRYASITRSRSLEDVLEGVALAVETGFDPVKINVLLLKDIDKNEIIKFLTLTLENPICVRFLEFMPVNSFYKIENPVSCRDVLEMASGLRPIEEAAISGNGPAMAYRLKGALGTFGLISPMSHKFCSGCNRLRLTSDGSLKACLHSGIKVDLRGPIRSGAGKSELIGLIKSAAGLKPKEHELDKKDISNGYEFSMCQIGG